MATFLLAHVIAFALLWNRLPMKLWTYALGFLYFWGVYFGLGHYLVTHPESYTPVMPLEDDYWKHWKPKKQSPFLTPEEQKRERDEESIEEELRSKRKALEEQAQPNTKP